MELNQYIRLFRQWAWLIVIAALVGGGIAFYARRSQAENYKASTSILIGSYLQASNPESPDISIGADLAKTYAEIVMTRPIMQSTIDELELDTNVHNLKQAVETEILEDTSILVISVTYGDQEAVAEIANELAHQLTLQSPTNLTEEQEQQISDARDEISQLNAEIERVNQRQNAIFGLIETETDPTQVDLLEAQSNVFALQSAQLRDTRADLQVLIATIQNRTNTLDIIEEAERPEWAEQKGVIQTAILGAVIGVILAAGLVLFINYQESTIKSPEQANKTLGLPVLGTIMRFGKSRDSYSQRLIAHQAPTSPIAETYHAVQTNMLLSANGRATRQGIYVVTSPSPGEGKSITAANLAVSMAQSGLRTLLIDADLRQPKVHEILEIDNKGHLSKLLTTPPSHYDLSVENADPNAELPPILQEHVQESTIANLMIITSGELPEIPAEVLHSEELSEWIKVLRAFLDLDVILFDTPPSLVVADSAILAANVHAQVVMVVEVGQTQRDNARKAKDMFVHTGSPITGVVLNKAKPREQSFVYGYGYQSSTRAAPSNTSSSSSNNR
ncbi:MAG: polysaccharide biosynthesis tyrosine autokinase [Chloroflexi bacterium]|nr:polysaccharide biosynthesis tyrosine autokinase [Chloroflexota bacterium]